MNNEPFAYDVRILSITSTTTAQLISKLVADRLATLTQTLPAGKSVVRMILTTSATLELRCAGFNTDAASLPTVTRHVFDVLNAHEKFTVKNAATVLVELYFGD